jgi:Ni,Fe-hydrogenase I cytochrome b subunit
MLTIFSKKKYYNPYLYIKPNFLSIQEKYKDTNKNKFAYLFNNPIDPPIQWNHYFMILFLSITCFFLYKPKTFCPSIKN